VLVDRSVASRILAVATPDLTPNNCDALFVVLSTLGAGTVSSLDDSSSVSKTPSIFATRIVNSLSDSVSPSSVVPPPTASSDSLCEENLSEDTRDDGGVSGRIKLVIETRELDDSVGLQERSPARVVGSKPLGEFLGLNLLMFSGVGLRRRASEFGPVNNSREDLSLVIIRARRNRTGMLSRGGGVGGGVLSPVTDISSSSLGTPRDRKEDGFHLGRPSFVSESDGSDSKGPSSLREGFREREQLREPRREEIGFEESGRPGAVFRRMGGGWGVGAKISCQGLSQVSHEDCVADCEGASTPFCGLCLSGEGDGVMRYGRLDPVRRV
jgi:hypothetical protein